MRKNLNRFPGPKFSETCKESGFRKCRRVYSEGSKGILVRTSVSNSALYIIKELARRFGGRDKEPICSLVYFLHLGYQQYSSLLQSCLPYNTEPLHDQFSYSTRRGSKSCLNLQQSYLHWPSYPGPACSLESAHNYYHLPINMGSQPPPFIVFGYGSLIFKASKVSFHTSTSTNVDSLLCSLHHM